MTGYDILTEPHLCEAEHDIKQFADDIRAKLTGGTSPTEIAAWPNKAERARRLLAGTASEADKTALATEAQLRGKDETPQQLAGKQIEREADYAKAIAAIDGYQSQTLRQLAQDKPDPFALPDWLDIRQQAASELLQSMGLEMNDA